MNLTMVTDLCSIGTLFAFVLVCGGVLMLQNKKDIPRGKFKTPYVNGKYVMPFLLFIGISVLTTYHKRETLAFLTNEATIKTTDEIINELNVKQINDLKSYLIETNSKKMVKYNDDITLLYENEGSKILKRDLYNIGCEGISFYHSGFIHFIAKIPTWIFILFSIFISVAAVLKNLSLIPTLGLLTCLYMMSQIGLTNWLYFTGWLCIGLVIYFGYSIKHSKLNVSVKS